LARYHFKNHHYPCSITVGLQGNAIKLSVTDQQQEEKLRITQIGAKKAPPFSSGWQLSQGFAWFVVSSYPIGCRARARPDWFVPLDAGIVPGLTSHNKWPQLT